MERIVSRWAVGYMLWNWRGVEGVFVVDVCKTILLA